MERWWMEGRHWRIVVLLDGWRVPVMESLSMDLHSLYGERRLIHGWVYPCLECKVPVPDYLWHLWRWWLETMLMVEMVITEAMTIIAINSTPGLIGFLPGMKNSRLSGTRLLHLFRSILSIYISLDIFIVSQCRLCFLDYSLYRASPLPLPD